MEATNHRHLITAAIAIMVLTMVSAFYWDRQQERNYELTRGMMQQKVAEEGLPARAPRARQNRPSFKPQVVALQRNISYKTIVQGISPSVVSVNTTSGSTPVAKAQPAAVLPRGRGPDLRYLQQFPNGRRGIVQGWGLGQGGLICPNCGMRRPCGAGIPTCLASCPGCGTQMVREEDPGPSPPQQPATQQPAAKSSDQPASPQYIRQSQPPSTQDIQRARAGRALPESVLPDAGSARYIQQPRGEQFQAIGRGGSGIIVNSRGYVLTSHHVVHGATAITVTLTSGRATKTYQARIVDEARSVDLVMLEIVNNGNQVFPVAPIGDSSSLSVGDEVLAIGSPFGLAQSTTFGIVSNTRRTLQVDGTTFSDIIQTDAPMNPGSSGGALVAMDGTVVGVNTAIYSPTRAFSGIGFAIPINRARDAFPEFIETGPQMVEKLKRAVPGMVQPRTRQLGWTQGAGSATAALIRTPAAAGSGPWLGIRGSTLDSTIRAAEGLPMARGVFVEEVFLNSSAWKAGLQGGDVILRVNGRAAKDAAHAAGLLAAVEPGSRAKLTIFRQGKSMRLRPLRGAASTERTAPARPRPAAAPFDPANADPPGLTGVLKGGELGVGEMEALGMGVETLAPEWRLAFKIPDNVTYGVVVSETGGLAGDAGILPGDVIQKIDRQPVRDISDYIKVMGKADLATGISFGINRQGHRFSLRVKG